MKQISKLPFFIVALAALFLSACNKNETSGASEDSSVALTPERTVTLTADDKMKFNLAEIRANAGEVLAITLENRGTMPKFSMGHNLVVLTLGADPEAFCAAAQTAATTDYVPAEKNNEIIAHTKLLGGGESDTVVFRVPKKKGDYAFLCSFPGHFQVGMKGKLIVQ